MYYVYVLFLLWYLTIRLHIWCISTGRVTWKYWKKIFIWFIRSGPFSIDGFRYHPAWKERYLHDSCYNFAYAMNQVFGLKMEIMDYHDGDTCNSMMHVYTLSPRQRKPTCIDISGNHTRTDIKEKYKINRCRYYEYKDEHWNLNDIFYMERDILKMWISLSYAWN